MHADHQVILDAIAAKRRLSVRYFDKKEAKEKERVVAPMDYGPLRGAAEPIPHYQFWDLEGRRKPLNIAVAEEDLHEVKLLEETFEPAEIITWNFKPNAWLVPRDWAEFS